MYSYAKLKATKTPSLPLKTGSLKLGSSGQGGAISNNKQYVSKCRKSGNIVQYIQYTMYYYNSIIAQSATIGLTRAVTRRATCMYVGSRKRMSVVGSVGARLMC